jgi:hypothetical protein
MGIPRKRKHKEPAALNTEKQAFMLTQMEKKINLGIFFMGENTSRL